MLTHVHCISLRSVKYSDSSSIATLWTPQLGRLSAVVPSGNGREAQRRRAIMMPLGVFEAQAHAKPGQEIATLKDARMLIPSPASQGDPTLTVISLFLADFLYAVLKDSGPEPLLGEYLFASIRDMAQLKGTALANFHLMFLYRLTQFLGIAPDIGSYGSGKCFDMKEARFVSSPPLHTLYLDPDKARGVLLLSRLNMRNIGRARLDRRARNEMLDAIIQYYTLHYAQVSSLPSLEVVRDIFA